MNTLLTIIGYSMVIMCIVVIAMATRNYFKYKELDAKYTEWDEERVDIIGQNGNEGLHYHDK